MARKRNDAEATSNETEVTGGSEQPAERPNYRPDQMLTLRQVAQYLGKGSGAIRKLTRAVEADPENGVEAKPAVLPTVVEKVEGTNIEVTRVPFSAVQAYEAAQTAAGKEPKARKERGERAPRAEGKQYLVRLTEEQFAKFRSMFDEAEIEIRQRYRGKKGKKSADGAENAEGQDEQAQLPGVEEVEPGVEVTEPEDTDDIFDGDEDGED